MSSCEALAARSGRSWALERTDRRPLLAHSHLGDLAVEALRISEAGLRRRRRLNRSHQDETIYLGTLSKMVAEGRTFADDVLARYHGPWKGSVDPVFMEYAF